MHEETDAETGEITSTAIAGLSAWEGGGVITEKKEGKVMPFQSLEQQIATPGGQSQLCPPLRLNHDQNMLSRTLVGASSSCFP